MSEARNQLLGALVGLGGTIAQAMDEIEGFVPCGRPAGVVLGGLAAYGDDEVADEELASQVEVVLGFIDHVSEHRGVPAHAPRTTALTDQERKLVDGLVGLAADAAGKGLPAPVNAFVYRALAALDAGDAHAVADALESLAGIRAEVEAL